MQGIAELQVTKGKKQWAGKEKARMQRNKRQEGREVLPGQEGKSQSPGQTEEDKESPVERTLQSLQQRVGT